jgi:dynein heavy chain
MNSEFLNKFTGETEWPDGVKKDFLAALHNFMQTLNEASMQAKGKTFLYIPNEDLNDVDTAAMDKDLLQRLETTVIFWTRQIKELVSNQDVNNQGESNTPLDEIKHWEDRNANLKGMATQLKVPKLKKIVEVLDKASSAYLQPFLELTKEIDKGADEASDNLTFLGLLQEPCKKIEQAEPKAIPGILPDVLNNVRIIFELSQHYNSMDRMKSLLTKIGN